MVFMNETFISVGSMKIAYVERNPDSANTIFFIHGNSGSSKMWQKQFDTDKLSNYRLIAIDLPGHGQSSRSISPFEDYSPIRTARYLSEAIRNLARGKPFILAGFSYGTNMVAEMLEFEIMPRGIVLIGSCVVGKDHGLDKVFKKNDLPSIFFYNETNKELVKNSIANSLSEPAERDVEVLTEDYLKVSPDFKPALFKAAGEGKISDEISALQKLNMPVFTIFGAEDGVVNIDYLDDFPFSVWRNHIYKLSRAGHYTNIDRPEECNQLLSEYIREILDHV
jgi:pimeloyl-ACP methyl ester carboxylesterase